MQGPVSTPALCIVLSIMHNLNIVCLDGYTLFRNSDKLHPQWERLTHFGDVTVFDRTPSSKVVSRLADADIALTNKTPITAADIVKLPNLRYIGVLATGYNIVDVDAARRAGIVVTNIPAYSTASVAQHAIALLLAIVNRVESYSQAVSRGQWTACPDFTFRIEEWRELAGKTFGVVGFGNTGRATAAIAHALGMNIAVFTSKNVAELPDGYVKMELDELFANADVVSLHCPLTPSTAHMVDVRRLRLMKNTAILINTGRGPLVDERALAKALVAGRIYAAGLDVLSTEPPKLGNPLLAAPNCYITPHVAWSSVEARNRLMDIEVENIKAFLEGNPVNVVN